MIRGSDDEGLALDQHHDRVKVAAGLVEVKLNCGGLVGDTGCHLRLSEIKENQSCKSRDVILSTCNCFFTY